MIAGYLTRLCERGMAMDNVNTVVVETGSGKIRGVKGETVYSFKGIPYAEPPVGERRFKPSVLKQPRGGVLDCMKYGPVSPQRVDPLMNPGWEFEQDEAECLNLNVWTPGADGRKRPVMFWIHGGGFSFGSGSWSNGANLARRGDVVVVTINYRVGIPGFLFIEGKVANLGLSDMITALQWVQDNIQVFGGDPGNVTIFGESAGAVAVCCLMAMPSAKGLFGKAISQSGTAHPHRHNPTAGMQGAADIMAELDIDGLDLDALVRVPLEKIVEAQTKLELQARRTGGDFPYGVYMDRQTMPAHPLEAIRNGYAGDISFMVGSNLDEAKLYALGVSRKPDWEELPGAVTGRIQALGKDETYAEKMIETYRKEREGMLPSEPQDIMDAIMTDLRFRIPAVRWAETQSRHQGNVFSYLFTYKSTAMKGVLGACHALEIPFVFGNLGRKARGIYPARSEETDRISEIMMDAWAAFARNGRPELDGTAPWHRYEPERRATMMFGIDTHLEDDPFKSERELWEGML